MCVLHRFWATLFKQLKCSVVKEDIIITHVAPFRYKLLLEDVIKNTPDSHPDKNSLKEALEQIEHVAWHINEQLREHENSMRMVDIQKSLSGGFPKIIAPGRKLLRQGNLMKVPRAGGSGQPRYFVLFSDMIMYCKIKSSSSGHSLVATLALPKNNALECGCMLPLKNTKGKVFALWWFLSIHNFYFLTTSLK